MIEVQPKQTQNEASSAYPYADKIPRTSLEYDTVLANGTGDRHTRHPEVQAKVSDVFGEDSDVAHFPHEATSQTVERYADYTDDYSYAADFLVPALRVGDMEREHAEAKLAAVENRLAGIALDKASGNMLTKSLKKHMGQHEIRGLRLEKEFSRARLDDLPTEEKSKLLAAEVYEIHKDELNEDALKMARRDGVDIKIS